MKIKRIIIKIIDIIFFIPFLMIMLFLIIINFLIFHLPKMIFVYKRKYPNKIISMIPASLEEVLSKGEDWKYSTYDMQGYFQPYINLFFPSTKNLDIMINQNNRFIEIKMIFRKLFNQGFILSVISFNNIIFLQKIANLIRREKITAILANTPFLEGINAYLLYLMSGCPNFLASHCNLDIDYATTGLPKYIPYYKLAKLVEIISYILAKEIYPIRESQKNYILKYYNKPEKMKVRHWGIIIDKWLQPADEKILQKFNLQGKDLIVFAGRLSPYNFIYDIIEIAEKVIKRKPNAFFLLLGEEAKGSGVREKLNEMIKKKNIINNILMPGYVNNAELIQYRKLAKVNIVTMGGFSLIEAAASGIPCVCYDIDWHWELIENNITGFLIEKGDIEKFAEAIIYLLDNPEIGKKMAEKALEKVMKNHTLEVEQRRKRELYEEFFKNYYKE